MDTNEYTPVPLDAIHLDDFKATQPSGQIIAPYKGQTVWVYGYGRGSNESARFAARFNAAESPEDQLRITSEFIAGEIARWDLRDARTGKAYGEPTADVVMTLPDPFFAWLTKKLMGGETPGKGDAGSGS